MDNYNGIKSQKVINNSQHLLEIRPEKDYQPCIWCINYSLQLERQERFVCNPKKEQQILFSSGSVLKNGSETRKLGVQELLGNECLDFFYFILI